MIRFKPNFLILLFFFVIKNLKAQDANYWQSSYSPGGMLTPGAAIAYDNDSSLYYYNPALFSKMATTQFSFHLILLK